MFQAGAFDSGEGISAVLSQVDAVSCPGIHLIFFFNRKTMKLPHQLRKAVQQNRALQQRAQNAVLTKRVRNTPSALETFLSQVGNLVSLISCIHIFCDYERNLIYG